MQMNNICCALLLSIELYNHVYAEDYVYYSDADISYKFHRIPQTWFNSVLICISEDATLAMPKSEYEANLLKSIFEKYRNSSVLHPADIDYFHLGFHGLFNEYEYITLQDESLEEVYHRWAVNRPARVETDQCGAMHCSGGLSNICCHRLKVFICQKRDDSLESHVMNKCYASDRGYTDGLLKSYKLHMSPRNWRDARAICHAEGGYLAIIRNTEEKQFLQKMLSDPEYSTPMTNERYYHAFIGLHDHFRENNFTTVLGEDVSSVYVDWSPGEPDGGRKENCVGIKTTGGYNDYQCNRPAVFICERSNHSKNT